MDRPRLFAELDAAASAPVTVLCAPAGSGKSTLVASWLRASPPDGVVAWVDVEPGEADATRFWGMVMDALRRSGAIPADDPLATVVPAPTGGQGEFLQRLLEGLGRLPRPVLLVLDDLHHLEAADALAGLELLLARAPAGLRVLLVSRHDVPLGLHRSRLAGDLAELRDRDLAFTSDETGALLAAGGVALGPGDAERLRRRTEGWATGLRLAALSLARHDSRERFVAEFSGTERTVAEYLLAEVLAAQRPEVRDALLRISILERVSGPLADALTGRHDGARLLLELESANAFVVALDVGRTWFRPHHLLRDLLHLELLREAPGEVPELHRRAALWLAGDGQPVAAIRHAQLARDWSLAVELLGRHWVQLLLDGEEATIASLLAELPADIAGGDAEVAAISAAGCLSGSRWADADALLARSRETIDAVPAERRRRAGTALGTAELLRARRLGGLDAALEVAPGLLDPDGASDPEPAALALMNLGIAECWTLHLADAEAHLQQGLELGRRSGRPYIEIGCLGALGIVASLTQRLDLAEERLRGSLAVAERVGWATHPQTGPTYVTLALVAIDRGRLAEGDEWLSRAEPILDGSPEPAALVGMRHGQGLLAFCRGRHADALAAWVDGVRLAGRLLAPHFLAAIERQWELRARLALGDVAEVQAALADDDGGAWWHGLRGRVRLAEGDAEGAAGAVAPVLSGEAFVFHPNAEIEAALVDALARAQLGQDDAAWHSTERALALAEPHGRVMVFMTIPGTRELLEAHPRHRTAHAAHLRTLLDSLGGADPSAAGAPAHAAEPSEPLSERELAVLRFLPTNLSSAEIGSELFLSVHTVKTHMRKLYAKLDVHTRAEAVARGRALGLLAPARMAG